MRRIMLAAAAALWIASLSIASPAAARWRVATSPHFVIYSEQAAPDLRRFAEQMERYDAVLRLLTGGNALSVGPASRVTVYQVASMADVNRLISSRYIAGFYIPRAGGSVAFVPARSGESGKYAMTAQSILLHEYAHHFMYLNLPAAYPSWFIEGFAEFASQTRFEDNGSITIGGPAMSRSWGLSRSAVSITDVLTGPPPRNALDQDELYARAWQLTHYLTFATDRKGQLDRYLRAVAAGTPRLKAATDAFGDLGKLTRDAYSYLKGRTLSAVNVAAGAVPAPAVSVAELSDGADAIMASKLVSQRGVDTAQAKALLPRAQLVAARFPDDPFVQRAMAEAHFDAGDYAGAIAAADRVIAAEPKNVDALVYRGRALEEQAKLAKATDEATWKEVRRWYLAANRADPTHPDPLRFFHASFAAAGQTPTRNAVVGLIESARLAPQDAELRMALVRQHLVNGNLAGARSALTPLGNDERGRGRVLAPVWTALDAGDAAAALAALDKAMTPAPTDGKRKPA